MNTQIALITGASAGIGYETAILLKQKGYTVYAAARRVEKMKPLENLGIHILPLDVTIESSMLEAVNSIISKEGKIDVLINNAGYGSFGALEDVTMEEARRQFEVNVFGLARLSQLIIPHMRKNQFGKIVNIASVAAHIYEPLGSWYHSTKFAVEGLSDCLRVELKPFGIDVIIIEPGPIKSEWSDIAMNHMLDTSGQGAYAATANKMAKSMKMMYSSKQVSKSDEVARIIMKSLSKRNPKARYTAGRGAKMVIVIRRVLGTRIFDQIISKMMIG